MPNDDEFFTPEDIDEQIDSLARGQGHVPESAEQADRIISHLRAYYGKHAQQQSDPLDRAWKRIVAQHEAAQRTLQRKGRLIYMPGYSQNEGQPGAAPRKKRTLFQRLGMLAAVLFIGLLIGGMVLLLNAGHQQQASKKQSNVASGGTPIPPAPHPITGGKCSIDTTHPAPQKSTVSVPGVYVFGMYAPSSNLLYRYDPQTRKVIWSRKFCSFFESNGTIEQDGILYLMGIDTTHESGSGMVSYLYALNETDGSAIWGVKFPTKVIPFQKGDPNYGSSPLDLGGIEMPTIANGIIYVAQETGVVYAFNAKTGGQLWTFNSGRNVWASSANGQGGGSMTDASIQVVNGVAYLSIVDRIFALDPATGRQLWTYSFDNALDINQSPVIDNGTLYLSAYEPHYGIGVPVSSYVYAFNAQTGAKEWASAKKSNYLAAPIAYNGSLHVISYDNTWYTLDPASGAFIAQKQIVADVFGPQLVNGVLYSLTENESNNTLAVLNPDGSPQWSVQVSGKYPIINDIKNGVIYVSGRGTGLYAYSATDGKLLWHYGGYHMQPDSVSLATVVP